MSVLLIAEHNNKELKPFTLNASTAASQIDNDVHAVIIGNLFMLVIGLNPPLIFFKSTGLIEIAETLTATS